MDGASISSMDDYNQVLDAHQVGDTITVAVRAREPSDNADDDPVAGASSEARRLTGYGRPGENPREIFTKERGFAHGFPCLQAGINPRCPLYVLGSKTAPNFRCRFFRIMECGLTSVLPGRKS